MAQTFSWKLTVEGTSGEHDFKVEPIKFGDGYVNAEIPCLHSSQNYRHGMPV